jgi:hypothetical protein
MLGFWHNVEKMLVACTITQNLFILTKIILKKSMWVALTWIMLVSASYLKCDYLNGKLLKLPCWSWSCWCVVSNPCYNSLLNCFVYVIIWFRSWTCASCKELMKFLYSCKTMFFVSKLWTISIQVGTNKKREKNNLIPQWKEEK